jgi:replicative DNA helicase
MSDLRARLVICDPITVADEMIKRSPSSDPSVRLIELAAGVPTAENILHYARIVRDRWRGRVAINHCVELQGRIKRGDDPDEAIAESVQALVAVTVGAESTVRHLSEPWIEMVDDLERSIKTRAEGGIRGATFGLHSVDDALGGMRSPELIIVAGAPGTGKTSLALQGMERVASEGGACLMFGLEMSAQQLAARMASLRLAINSKRIRIGDIDIEDFRRIKNERERILKERIYVDCRTRTMDAIVAKARAWRAQHRGVQTLVVIDFLQQLAGRDRGVGEAQWISQCAYSCKGLAKDIDSPVILCSSVSNEAIKGMEPPKMEQATKGSGDGAYAGDMVLCLWPGSFAATDSENRKPVDLHVLKDRSGGTGYALPLEYEGRHYRFRELSRPPSIDAWDDGLK